ncbi:MAG: two-component system response regulator [Deltaproteobacteria bacterium HGW-Deltaproteobacteria-15]|jgi:CheY-like chemotaxis protein|nr:MAG: two-component system response regulator [Deltaproteobacteria bacterium HGW-Deltaproteobacteria-15]
MNPLDQHFKPTILVAEDDPDDRIFLEQALKVFNDVLYLHFVEDGEKLIEYLHHRGEYATSMPPKPGLILLDLNMPRKNGREALLQIKEEADLKDIPLIVWTTSSEEEDIRLSSDAGAEGYVTKPCSFIEIETAIKDIIKKWLQLPARAV